MYDIKIIPALNGYIIKVGCATLVAEKKETMLAEISRYLDNPETVEKQYMANPQNRIIIRNVPGECLRPSDNQQGDSARPEVSECGQST